MYKTRPDLFNKIDIKVDFHTHLSRFEDRYRLIPTRVGPYGGDIGHRERQLEKNPWLKFLIITNPKPFYY